MNRQMNKKDETYYINYTGGLGDNFTLVFMCSESVEENNGGKYHLSGLFH